MKYSTEGERLPLSKKRKVVDYRKESYEVVYHSSELQEGEAEYGSAFFEEVINIQVHNQYRVKNNIPFPDEILEIREKYGLSATKMSEVLGFGVNSYRQYESGEMPSIANAKLIKIVEDPHIFMKMVELCSTLDDNTKAKFIECAQKVIEEESKMSSFKFFENYFLGVSSADIYTGYRKPDFQKLIGMIHFFTKKLSPSREKMNQLLFYADFRMFRVSCFSISGMRYKATEEGLVLNNYHSLFEFIENNSINKTSEIKTPEERLANQIISGMFRIAEDDVFSQAEHNILISLAIYFENKSDDEVVEISKKEEAWKQNVKEKNIISYEYAFDLKR